MKPQKNLILPAIVLALTPFFTAQGQIIFDSTPASANTDVFNTGTAVLAYSPNDNTGGGDLTTTPVNGVTFSGDSTQNGVTFSIVGSPNQFPPLGAGPGLSPEYTAVLADIVYDFSDSFSLQLTNLTPGQLYTAEIFGGDTGTSQPGSELITDDSNGTNAKNIFVIPTTGTEAAFIYDTFTANLSGEETITLSSDGDAGSFPVFDAINLRTGTAPEPSTWALLVSGLAGLIWLGRRRVQS